MLLNNKLVNRNYPNWNSKRRKSEEGERTQNTEKPWNTIKFSDICIIGTQKKKKEWDRRNILRNGGLKFIPIRASLVAQWLRSCLPMQGTWVRALVWEDPTCCEATKPMHHNYWGCALEPVSHNYWAHVPQPMHLEPVLRNKRSNCNEKPAHHN